LFDNVVQFCCARSWPATVACIEGWLARKGRRLRRSDEDIAAIVCGFRVKPTRGGPDRNALMLSRTHRSR
jgi:hypothetical protein